MIIEYVKMKETTLLVSYTMFTYFILSDATTFLIAFRKYYVVGRIAAAFITS